MKSFLCVFVLICVIGISPCPLSAGDFDGIWILKQETENGSITCIHDPLPDEFRLEQVPWPEAPEDQAKFMLDLEISPFVIIHEEVIMTVEESGTLAYGLTWPGWDNYYVELRFKYEESIDILRFRVLARMYQHVWNVGTPKNHYRKATKQEEIIRQRNMEQERKKHLKLRDP